MNRKIMLLPLTAALVFGLASCDNAKDDSDVSSTTTYDGGISDVSVGDVALSGIVAQKGTKGWMLDDGKASIYVFGALAEEFKVGDHVTVTGTCTAYWGLFEITKATVAKSTKDAPKLSDPIELTADELTSLWNITSVAKETDTTFSPTKSKRYKLTGVTAESVAGYAGFSVSGFSSAKLKTYYYDSVYNVTVANQKTKIYAGCKYDVSFYYVGTGSDKNVNMGIFDVTAHYDAVESVSVAGDNKVATGDSITLTGSTLPATADQGLTWSSSDESVAKVSSYGKVTGVKEGSVTITATSTADTTKKAEFAVSVVTGKTYTKVADASFSKANNTIAKTDDHSNETPAYTTYTSSSGVVIKNEKGTSQNHRVWNASEYNLRIYQGANLVISCDNDFSRLLLTCDCYGSDEYCSRLKESNLPTGAKMDVADHVITITLSEAAKSATLSNFAAQVRVKNIELQA